jgi:large repetitive protein
VDPFVAECDVTDISALVNAWIAAVTADDNCSDAAITHDFDGTLPEPCADPITVTFTATDDCGNSSTITSTITIDDSVAPVFQAVDPFVAECDVTDISALVNAWIAAVTADDNCSGAAITHDFDGTLPEPCADPITVTFTAIDDCGNSSTITSTITIDDSVAPVFQPVDPFVAECDVTDISALVNAWIAAVTADDNCSDAAIVTHDFDGTLPEPCADPITVTFTAIDDCGNSSTITSTITIDDSVAPVFQTVDPFVAECDVTDISALVNAWIAAVTADDNCSGAAITHDFDGTLPEPCADPITVTFTATDDCGNSSTITSTITIDDSVAPVFQTVDPFVAECDVTDISALVNAWIAAVTADDNCSDAIVTHDFDGTLPEPCADPITVTFTATDDCGNSSTITSTITIDDSEAPTFTLCPAPLTIKCKPSTDLIAEINAWAATAAASDNCDNSVEISNDFDPDNLPGLCGAPSPLPLPPPITAEIPPPAPPPLPSTMMKHLSSSDCPKDEVIECRKNTDLLAEIMVWLDTAEARDNCDNDVTITHDFDFNNLPPLCGNAVTVTFTATDDCGNTATCIATIRFDDTVDPVFVVCPDELLIECVNGDDILDTINAWIGTATASDDCDQNVSITTNFDPNILPELCGEPLTVIFTATDECGNTSTQLTQLITIDDNEAPSLTVPAALPLEACQTADISTITGGSTCLTAKHWSPLPWSSSRLKAETLMTTARLLPLHTSIPMTDRLAH